MTAAASPETAEQIEIPESVIVCGDGRIVTPERTYFDMGRNSPVIDLDWPSTGLDLMAARDEYYATLIKQMEVRREQMFERFYHAALHVACAAGRDMLMASRFSTSVPISVPRAVLPISGV